MPSLVIAARDGVFGDLKVWVGQATSVNGVATFFPTDDGSASGSPLFSTIYHVLAIAQNNATDAVTLPLVGLKSISADRSTVKIGVVIGTTLAVLGPTLAGAPDGTPVHCLVLGV